MNEEDRKIALSQITTYDQFLSSISIVNGQRHYTAVVLPPKAPNTKEKWVGVCAADGSFNTSFRQPDPERIAVCGNNDNGCLCYGYADELPRCFVLAVVFTVILSILTTPLLLLCCVPMIHGMNKVNNACHYTGLNVVGKLTKLYQTYQTLIIQTLSSKLS